MINLDTIEIQILEHLKVVKKATLASLSKTLDISKSTLAYNLDQLVEKGLAVREEITKKTIYYKLIDKASINQKIDSYTESLYDILVRTTVEGLDAYENLLNLVANGESDVIGYGNIEGKVIPELDQVIENFRDKFAATGRKDRFVVPDSLANIELLEDHYRKPEWAKCFKGRVIDREIMNINADIYCWDQTVGVCSFEGKRFEVTIYNDNLTVETYRSLLNVLWESAEQPH